MKTKSVKLGKSISEVEVTNVSGNGIWIFIRDREAFLSFDEFPWFRMAPIGHILNVVNLEPEHLYWPDLDVDLSVESIFHPEHFPLVARTWPNNRPAPDDPSSRR